MIRINHTLKSGEKKSYLYDKSRYEYECFKDHRRKYNKIYYSDSGKYPRRLWDEKDEKIIMYSSLPDRELAAKIHRSLLAIHKRRCVIKQEGRPWLDKDKIKEKATKPSM